MAALGLVFSAVMWGTSYSFIKFLLAYMGPNSLAFLRSAISASILMSIVLVRGRVKIKAKDYLLMAALGSVGLGANVILFHRGVNLTTTSHASLLTSTSPIITALLSWFFLGEFFNWKKGVGILLSFAGVSLTVFEGISFHMDANMLLGDMTMLIAALFWAVYTVMGKPILYRYPPLLVSAYTLSFGSLFIFPFAYSEGLFHISLDFGIRGWAAMAFITVFVTALAMTLWYNGLKRFEPAQVIIFMNIIPVVAAIIAIVFLGEKITPFFIAGMAMVIGGVCIVSTSSRGKVAKVGEAQFCDIEGRRG